jgi:uracil-DNA glycosylase
MWFEQMHPAWQRSLAEWREWLNHVESQLSKQQDLVPPLERVMAAFSLAPDQIRVVILGQDPYPTRGVAVGRAFAVAKDHAPIPASLRNVFKELQADLQDDRQPGTTLESWQSQGVWLLNRHLTATEQSSAAHFALGWDSFTQAAIEHLLVNSSEPLAFVLWGKQAQSIWPLLIKYSMDDPARFLILQSPHPSPLSAHRGFFGSKPFSQVNAFLSSKGGQTVDWVE